MITIDKPDCELKKCFDISINNMVNVEHYVGLIPDNMFSKHYSLMNKMWNQVRERIYWNIINPQK